MSEDAKCSYYDDVIDWAEANPVKCAEVAAGILKDYPKGLTKDELFSLLDRWFIAEIINEMIEDGVIERDPDNPEVVRVTPKGIHEHDQSKAYRQAKDSRRDRRRKRRREKRGD